MYFPFEFRHARTSACYGFLMRLLHFHERLDRPGGTTVGIDLTVVVRA
jgi:hypothetical protein